MAAAEQTVSISANGAMQNINNGVGGDDIWRQRRHRAQQICAFAGAYLCGFSIASARCKRNACVIAFARLSRANAHRRCTSNNMPLRACAQISPCCALASRISLCSHARWRFMVAPTRGSAAPAVAARHRINWRHRAAARGCSRLLLARSPLAPALAHIARIMLLRVSPRRSPRTVAYQRA